MTAMCQLANDCGQICLELESSINLIHQTCSKNRMLQMKMGSKHQMENSVFFCCKHFISPHQKLLFYSLVMPLFGAKREIQLALVRGGTSELAGGWWVGFQLLAGWTPQGWGCKKKAQHPWANLCLQPGEDFTRKRWPERNPREFFTQPGSTFSSIQNRWGGRGAGLCLFGDSFQTRALLRGGKKGSRANESCWLAPKLRAGPGPPGRLPDWLSRSGSP